MDNGLPILLAVDVNQLWDRLAIRQTFRATPYWGWAALAGCIFAGLVGAKIVKYATNKISEQFGGRNWKIRQLLAASLARPLALVAFTAGLVSGVGFLKLSGDVAGFCWSIAQLLIYFAVGWLLYNIVDVVEQMLWRYTARTKSKLDDQLVPLVRKTLRIVLVVLFGLFVADNVFNANIGSFLAGLGIVGLAVSLASQDTVKNFFGSVTIFIDQPFNLGDRIILTGFDGTVEEIGFRSTKLRTATGHVVQIPNGKFVDSIVENLSRRRFFRRTIEVPLKPGATAGEIERAREVIREVIADPQIAEHFDEKSPPLVVLTDYPAGKTVLKLSYSYVSAGHREFEEHTSLLNLRLLQRLTEAGLS